MSQPAKTATVAVRKRPRTRSAFGFVNSAFLHVMPQSFDFYVWGGHLEEDGTMDHGELCETLLAHIMYRLSKTNIKQLESPQLLSPNSTHGEWSHLQPGRFRSPSQPRPRRWAAHRLSRPLGAWMPPADGSRSRHVRSWCRHKTSKCCQMLSDVVRSQSKRMSPSLKNSCWNGAKYVKLCWNNSTSTYLGWIVVTRTTETVSHQRKLFHPAAARHTLWGDR